MLLPSWHDRLVTRSVTGWVVDHSFFVEGEGRGGRRRTRSEVDDYVQKEDGVWETVEGDPPDGQVVVEERNGYGQDDQVCHQKQKHAQVPVEPVKYTETRVFVYLESSRGALPAVENGEIQTSWSQESHDLRAGWRWLC